MSFNPVPVLTPAAGRVVSTPNKFSSGANRASIPPLGRNGLRRYSRAWLVWAVVLAPGTVWNGVYPGGVTPLTLEIWAR